MSPMILPLHPIMVDDDLRLFRDSAERFFARAVPPERAAKWRADHRVEREFWREVGEAGFLGLPFPEQYGGSGLDYRYEAAMMDLVSRMDLNFPYAGQDPVICRYVLMHGTEEQKRRWLPRMAKGDLVAAVAMSEPGAGSDLQSVRTTARRDGDEFIINGTKMFISNGQIADWILVVCKTDPEAGSRGISLIAVETDHVRGFRRGRTLDKIGLDAQDTSELFFDDVRVPVNNLLGGVEGQGFRQLMQELPRERMAIAIDAVATMERAIAHTVDCVAQRQVFGKMLSDLQNTQFKLAECKTLAAAAKALTYDGVAKVLDGSLDNPTSAMIKLFTSETAGRIVDECLQLHGGYGYINDYPIARMYRDSRIFRIYGGSSEVMKMIIARSM